MKRIISIIMSILMVLSVSLAFTSCSNKEEEKEKTKKEKTTDGIEITEDNRSDEEKIIGTWKGEFDFTKMINDELAEEMGEPVEFGSFKIPYIFTFNSDGTGSVKFDENEREIIIENFKKNFSKVLLQMLEKEAEAEGMKLEDAMAVLGVSSKEELVNKLLEEQFDIEDIVGEFEEEANEDFYYKIKNGKLLTGETEDDYDEEIGFSIDGSTLTIKSYNSDDSDDSLGVLPATFTKQ